MSRNASVHWDTAKGAWRTDAGGKTHYFRGIAKNHKAEAKIAFEAYLRDIGARYVRTSDPTVAQLAEMYLRHSQQHARPRTLEGHIEMLRAFALFPNEDSPSRYGLRRARTIRGADLTAMEQAWAERDLSPHYRARLIRSVKACWAWASKGDTPLLPSNPLKDVPGVAIPYSRKRRVPKEEFGPFLRWCWRRAKRASALSGRFEKLACLLVRFVRETGCRPGEACDLRWTDSDWEAQVAVIPPERHKTGGKTGRPRILILNPGLIRPSGPSNTWKGTTRPGFSPTSGAKGSPSGAPTRGQRGSRGRLESLAQKVRKLREAALRDGIPVRPDFRLYDLRHEVASAGRARGVGDDQIAVVLGTSAKMIATTYGHLTTDDLRNISDQMRGDSAKP